MFVSENLQNFYKGIITEDLVPNLLSKKIGKEIKDVAEELGIGKILISVNIPASFCEKPVVITDETIFEKLLSVGDQHYSDEFVMTNGGKIKFSAVTTKKSEWTAQAEKDISFLFQLFFVLYNRSYISKSIKKAAHTDSLTGVYNNTGMHALAGIITSKHLTPKFSVIFLNIRHFKQFNDTYGGKIGDVMLRSFSNYMVNILGKDGGFGRLGGDNFLIIVKSSRIPELLKTMDNLRIPVRCEDFNQQVEVKLKAGIANGANLPPQVPCTALIGNASAAFKVAKKSDIEDFVFFKPEMMTTE